MYHLKVVKMYHLKENVTKSRNNRSSALQTLLCVGLQCPLLLTDYTCFSHWAGEKEGREISATNLLFILSLAIAGNPQFSN